MIAYQMLMMFMHFVSHTAHLNFASGGFWVWTEGHYVTTGAGIVRGHLDTYLQTRR